MKVVFPNEETAVIGYKVTQDMTVDGKPTKLVAADSSTWIKHDGRWLCVQHSEAPMGDPYGRS